MTRQELDLLSEMMRGAKVDRLVRANQLSRKSLQRLPEAARDAAAKLEMSNRGVESLAGKQGQEFKEVSDFRRAMEYPKALTPDVQDRRAAMAQRMVMQRERNSGGKIKFVPDADNGRTMFPRQQEWALTGNVDPEIHLPYDATNFYNAYISYLRGEYPNLPEPKPELADQVIRLAYLIDPDNFRGMKMTRKPNKADIVLRSILGHEDKEVSGMRGKEVLHPLHTHYGPAPRVNEFQVLSSMDPLLTQGAMSHWYDPNPLNADERNLIKIIRNVGGTSSHPVPVGGKQYRALVHALRRTPQVEAKDSGMIQMVNDLIDDGSLAPPSKSIPIRLTNMVKSH